MTFGPPILNRLVALLLCAALCTVAAARSDTSRVPTVELDYAVSDDPRGAIRRAKQWRDEARAKGDKVRELSALRLSAKAHEQGEELPALRQDVAAGLALARELKDTEAEAEFLTQAASLLAAENKYEEATRAFEEVIAFAERNNLRSNIAKAQAAKAHMYITLDRGADALALLVEAHAYFETHHDKLGMTYTFSLMAQVFALDPDEKTALTKSIDYNRRAIALMDPKKSRHDISVHFHNLGVDYARAKDRVAAREHFEKSLAIASQLEDRVSVAYLDYRIAELDREEGQLPKVLPALARALPVFEDTGNSSMQFLTQISRTRTLTALDRRREANEALAKARALAKQIDAPWVTARTHETAMQLFARYGEHEKAFREAAELRLAEQAVTKANNARMVAELERRFDSRQKEIENQLLRARQQESEARRLSLILGLVLVLSLLTGLVVFFARQAQRNRRFQALAMKDDLTGLPNRRSILEFARGAVQRRREGDGEVTIALIDIDHFKSINDEFGHAIGDAVLTSFAQACLREMRANDRLGRFGGKSFCW